MCEFLVGAAWVCGEYAEIRIEDIIPKLLSFKISCLSPSIQSVYLFAFLKLSSRFPEKALEAADPTALDNFTGASDFNLQERATVIQKIWLDNKFYSNSSDPSSEKLPWNNVILAQIFRGITFNMVAPGAQEKLPINLDLDSWLVPILDDEEKVDESRASSDEKLDAEYSTSNKDRITKKNIGFNSSTGGSSVLYKPSPKKFILNTKYDGEELVNHSHKKDNEREISPKVNLSRGSRFNVPNKRTFSFSLPTEKRDSLKILATYTHDFKDISATELTVNVTISTEPSFPITLLVQSVQLPSNEIICTPKRSNTEVFFHSNSKFQLKLEKVRLFISDANYGRSY